MDGGRLRWQSGFNLSALLAGQGNASSITLGDAKRAVSKNASQTFQYDATPGSGEFDTVVVMENTIAASGSATYDLFDDTLTDVFDAPVTLDTVKFVWVALIANPDGTTGAASITVGNAAAEPHQLWFGADTDTAQVFKDGPPFCQGSPAGKTVDASNNRVLLTNDDATNAATVLVVILGDSA